MNIDKSSEKSPLLVNIQIPFCTGHCKYCDFKSYGKDRALFHRYLSALKKEISSATSDLADYELTSVHITGDNLLSMMSADALEDFLRFLRQMLPTSEKTQWVIEMLPYELSAASLTVLRNAHLDVLHLNVGTCQMKEFRTLERPYYYAAFDGALSMISMYQQDNISIGLLVGLPGQTEESLLRSLQYVTKAQPMQLSLQPCAPNLEAGTTLSEAADSCLASFGLYRYGDGWHYAIPGRERLEYISGADTMDCIGFGVGARTQMEGYRYHNTENMELYLEHSTEPASIACDVKAVEQKARL